MKKMLDTFRTVMARREWVFVLGAAVLFIMIRLPAVHFPLHQDEYKWPMITNPALQSDVSIPHPPLGEAIYREAGKIVGYNVNFRFVPLMFGTFNLLLLFYFLREAFGKREAVIGSLLWIFSYFSVLASLMVDTDGEVLPFFFLLLLIGYFKWQRTLGRERMWWGLLVVLSIILGFFVKVSFLLAPAAVALDFLWREWERLGTKTMFRYAVYGLLGLLGLFALLILSQYIFTFFDFKTSLTYWEHFWNTSRDWFQTGIQCIKALLYTSPLLAFLPVFARKKDFDRTRVLWIFLGVAFLFYIVIFDFSLGALDRYLQCVILPLTIIGSSILAPLLFEKHKRIREVVFLSLAFGLALVLLQSLSHYVPSLHPKAAWIGRVLSLRWNFVYPFSGGSGPLGFYVSFLFMALSWIASMCVVALGFFRKELRTYAVFALLSIGFLYNLVFTEEYLFGYWNGSAPRLLSHAVAFIKNNPDIAKVTVYNDNGGDEIRAIGKYRKRLYTDPKFDLGEKIASLNQYKEHYFVLDVPRIDPHSIYAAYLASCKVVYNETDQKISATVYDCRGVPNIQK